MSVKNQEKFMKITVVRTHFFKRGKELKNAHKNKIHNAYAILTVHQQIMYVESQ